MPIYGVALPGGGVIAVYPCDTGTKLFDGTETPATGLASMAIERGPSNVGSDNGVTFQTIFPAAPTATVLFQGSNVDVEADYETLYTSTNVQYDNYTDTNRWRYYRVKLSSYVSGGMPQVVLQR